MLYSVFFYWIKFNVRHNQAIILQSMYLLFFTNVEGRFAKQDTSSKEEQKGSRCDNGFAQKFGNGIIVLDLLFKSLASRLSHSTLQIPE